ncbi:MAG: adenylosuccinate synthetase, partial [Planctomycetales bacterium]
RGKDKHGSCGMGIGETRHYWLRHGSDAVVARDLQDRPGLISKLTLLRDRFLLECQDLPHIAPDWHDLLRDTTPTEEADVLQEAASELTLADSLPTCRFAIFEGSQGVLLDEWRGFHPYTTWSTVTPAHALEMTDEHGFDDVTVLGVTRAYATRHGAGPMPTWRPKLFDQIPDPGNPRNAWQDAMRTGPLDLVLLKYAAEVAKIDGLIVNGLDQVGKRPVICERYRDFDRVEIPRGLREQSRLTAMLETASPEFRETTPAGLLEALGEIAPVAIIGRGPTSEDKTFTGAGFLVRNSNLECAATSR